MSVRRSATLIYCGSTAIQAYSIVYNDIIDNTKDMTYGGAYKITGTSTKLGIPDMHKVCLFERETKICLACTVTNSAGEYAFNNIMHIYRGYFVAAFDGENNIVNAAISDYVTPEPM